MTVTKKKGEPAKITEHVITVVSSPVMLSTSDISTWKNAVNSARFGQMRQLYTLYENLLADGPFSEAIDKRTRAITNTEILFTDVNNDPVQNINDLIDTPEFEHLLTEIMNALGYGISVVDVMKVLPFEVFSVPRRNINAKKKLILPDEYSETGMSYEGVPYIFEVKNLKDPFGYIYKAAPYVIYKRGGYGDWAQFVELFGMPFRLGKYSAYDTATRDELIKAMTLFGAKPWAVVPKEAEISQEENSSTGDGALYDKFVDRCDNEMLITVLGQNMTTKDGSSRSQGQVHKDVEEELNKSDRKFVRRILNRHLVPILELAGLPVKGGKFTFPEQGEALSTKDKVDVALRVKADGIPVSDDYIYEISGVRKPEDGEVISSGKTGPEKKEPEKEAEKKATTKANALARAFSFFVQALGSERAPLKF